MPYERGYGLLVGVGTHQYESRLDVPVTVGDALALGEVLGDVNYCGYPQNQVTVLHDSSATKAGILGALEALSERIQAEDTLVIFYSGHGEYGTDDEYYLVSHDARLEERKVKPGTGVSQGELLSRLARIKAQRVLMVFNACHSGEISPTLGVEDNLGAKSLPETTASALLSTGSGRIIITACREGQYSYVGAGEQTLFAQALLDGLRGKGIRPRGGFISAFDLYTSVYETVSGRVQELFNRTQQPELTVLKGLGTFAVSLYRGAADTNLSAAEAQKTLPSGAAVRPVDPEDSKILFQQVIEAQGSQIINAGRDVTQTINTGGGAYVGGGVNLGSGDFVGRDKVVYGDEVRGDKVGGDKISGVSISDSSGIGIGRGSTGFSVGGDIHGNVSIGANAEEIERLFQPVLQAIAHAPGDVQAQAISKVDDLKTEAAKGEAANDGIIAGLLNEIKKLVPQAAGALLQAFASPLLQKSAGDLTELVLKTFR